MVRAGNDAHRALFAVHGLGVRLACDVAALWGTIDHLLDTFGGIELPADFTTTSGHVRSYDEADVARHLSASATRVPVRDDLLELYQDGERFWLVDDRWGICELNLLKGSWRSWVLPHAHIDEFRVVENAVLWPLAQLLKRRGLELVPAVSIERDGFGVLLLSGFNLLPELDALLRYAGFKLVGQRWTALREDAGRVELLHVPGRIELMILPRRGTLSMPRPGGWVDLHDDHGHTPSPQAFCSTACILEPGRRQTFKATSLRPGAALTTLRDHWPVVDLQPAGRASPLLTGLSRTTPTYKLELSRDPHDLITWLDDLQDQSRPHVTVTVTNPFKPVAARALAG